MLDYVALALLIGLAITRVAAVVTIFDLPYRSGIRRSYPQRDAPLAERFH